MQNCEDCTTKSMHNALSYSQLGMKDMFLLDLADFSGITGSTELHVSDVLQKAFLEVTELGTEAGASSGKSQSEKSMMSVVNLNHNLGVFMLKEGDIFFVS